MTIASSRDFEARVDSWVLSVISRGSRDFQNIVCALPGVYPVTVFESMQRLEKAGLLPAAVLEKARREVQRDPPHSTIGSSSVLPLPHPLDYEWRFSRSTCDLLIEESLRLSSPGSTVFFLGTPAAYEVATVTGTPRSTVFVGEDNTITNSLRTLALRSNLDTAIITCHDAKQYSGKASLTILDPPWYFDYIKPLLKIACDVCAPDGHILMSLSPAGTRPSAERDRLRILRFARRLGLILIERRPGCLQYDMPFFERNALSACSVRNIPIGWRRGELLIFSRSPLTPSEETGIPAKSPWPEVSVQGVRFRLRPYSKGSTAGPRLGTIVEGDILPTVSRRDPRRASVGVWTSGNRVFECEGTNEIRSILLALSKSQDPIREFGSACTSDTNSLKAQLVERATTKLQEVIALETCEAARWANDRAQHISR